MNPTYQPMEIERAVQALWQRERAYATPARQAGRHDAYVYACTPFTTGKAHMGHVRSYTLADVHARWRRSQGAAVLWCMGFDSFGLPNEQAALASGVQPAQWVARCRAEMIGQFDRLGLSVDWSRIFDTSDPGYYRWTQWVFLRFLERGLVRRGEGSEHWCAQCHSVLAALQVEDGRCWRCGSSVTVKTVAQWYLRLDDYADELEQRLDQLVEWDATVLAFQRSLIGRTDGSDVELMDRSGERFSVFSAGARRPDAAAFVAFSPAHEYVRRLARTDARIRSGIAGQTRSLDRTARKLSNVVVVDTGRRLQLVDTDVQLPMLVTPEVDVRYGGGAALGFPDADTADQAILAAVGLTDVRADREGSEPPTVPSRRYRLRDNSISRQRMWGAPVPVIHCPECGLVPVPDADLPVRLPADLVITSERSSLADHPGFSSCLCPCCGGEAQRDPDTLDVHFDSIWMLVPFCVPPAERAEQMFSSSELERWLPVEQVVCGADQAGWWINDRLLFKVLADLGYFSFLTTREPVKSILMHEMVLSEGRKMSKSLGNAVDAEALVDEFGADAVRLAVISVDARRSFNWTRERVADSRRRLERLWRLAWTAIDAVDRRNPHASIEETSKYVRFERARDSARRRTIAAYEAGRFHTVVHELRRLQDAAERHQRKPGWDETAADARAFADTVAVLVELLRPITPHLGEVLLPELRTALDSSHGRRRLAAEAR